MKRQPLFVVLLLLIIVVVLYREVSVEGDLPVFFIERTNSCFVEFGYGFGEKHCRHVVDVSSLDSVNNMTKECCHPLLLQNCLDSPGISTGQVVDLIENGQGEWCLNLSYMGAAKRIALGITLHPDQMTKDDWRVLPGIGESLATRIIVDRQENGDFYTLKNLKRVDGISDGKIAQWQSFF